MRGRPPRWKEGIGEEVRKETAGGGLSRWAAAVAGFVALLAVLGVLLAISAGGSNASYTVRAIFDDAGNIIPGENVKIDGVKVGTVGSVVPTPQAKAAVTLDITNPGFKNFRADASCTIRPQALIGEKYVDCLPTQVRPEGTPLPPPLQKIRSGQEGEGQYLLPLANTHSPVDVDLLGDISRLPERQRFTIILNELGAGLAGRGSDLREVIRRADPALREFDAVLKILAGENKVLAQLAVDSDRALAPFARVREHVADFIVQSKTVAQATAAHRGALSRNFHLFPKFLEQLGPAMDRLAHFADETTPTFTNLKAAAPGIDQAFQALPGFSNSSATFFQNLGKTAKQSGPALVGTQPLLKRLQAFGGAAKPFSASLAELTTSLRDTGGLERLMDFIFLGTTSANGYDALGHFLRTEGVATPCLTYATKFTSLCIRKLGNTVETPTGKAAFASAARSSKDVVMARTLAVLGGESPAQAIAEYPGGSASGSRTSASSGSTHAPAGSSTTQSSFPAAPEGNEAGSLLLNYLLGS
jgi:phospholipid/cholesterol/gamma-HCH transport system substrate-binding protein